jgi:hypothetical protein
MHIKQTPLLPPLNNNVHDKHPLSDLLHGIGAEHIYLRQARLMAQVRPEGAIGGDQSAKNSVPY